MYLSDLVKKSSSELKKISKEEIIETITSWSHQYTQKDTEIKNLKQTIENDNNNIRAVMVLMKAFLKEEIEKEEYSRTIDYKELNILELTGKVLRLIAEKRS